MTTSALHLPRLAALVLAALALVAACGPGGGATGRPGGPIQTPAGATPEMDVVTSPDDGDDDGDDDDASPGGGGGTQSMAP